MFKKNLLIVAPYGFVDRMANYIEFITARLLVKQQWKVTAIVQSIDTKHSSVNLVSGIKVFRYSSLLKGLYFYFCHIFSEPPQIVHIHNLRNNRLAIAIAIITKYIIRKPLVFTEYGLLHDHYLTDNRDNPLDHPIKYDNVIKTMSGLFKNLWKNRGYGCRNAIKNYFFHWPLTHADTVVFVSKHNIPIAKTLGLKNIQYLPYFVDSERWSYTDIDFDAKKQTQSDGALQKLNGLKAGKHVLYIGQFKLRKGWDILLRAIPFVPSDIISNFIFITNSYYTEPVEFSSLVETLGIRSRVTFLGKVDSATLKCAYEICSIVTLPSRYEGFGLPALEAFEASRPVVASDVDAITDTVIDGKNGLLVPPGNLNKLSEAIQLLSRDENLRNKIIAGGHLTIKQLGSEENKQLWISFYENLLHD